ncbi:MAG: hypothetical protein JXR25_05490, partial [Pontiellaceae bacterium]|nr:hypothetical protein [Pontiellaceae bacterium]
IEKISPERTFEILQAFSELYAHWQDRPYFDRESSGYSLFISIDDSWRMALSVKDRGSDALTKLLEVIKYPEGLTLEDATPAEETPGLIRVSSEKEDDSAETGK